MVPFIKHCLLVLILWVIGRQYRFLLKSILHNSPANSFQLILAVFWHICDVVVDGVSRITSWWGKGLGEAVFFAFVTWSLSLPSVLSVMERNWMSEWTLATVWRRIPPVLSRYASPSCSTRGVSKDSAAKCVIVISGWPKSCVVSKLEFFNWHPAARVERTGYIMSYNECGKWLWQSKAGGVQTYSLQARSALMKLLIQPAKWTENRCSKLKWSCGP